MVGDNGNQCGENDHEGLMIPPSSQLFITWGLTILGCGGLGFAIHLQRRSARFAARATRLRGTIVELIPGDEGVMTARYRFRDTKGIERTRLSKGASSPPAFALDQEVEVLFDPASGESTLDTWAERHGAVTILCLFSGAALIAGLWGICG